MAEQVSVPKGDAVHNLGGKTVMRYHPESEWWTRVHVSITHGAIKMQAVIVEREDFEICD